MYLPLKDILLIVFLRKKHHCYNQFTLSLDKHYDFHAYLFKTSSLEPCKLGGTTIFVLFIVNNKNIPFKYNAFNSPNNSAPECLYTYASSSSSSSSSSYYSFILHQNTSLTTVKLEKKKINITCAPWISWLKPSEDLNPCTKSSVRIYREDWTLLVST